MSQGSAPRADDKGMNHPNETITPGTLVSTEARKIYGARYVTVKGAEMLDGRSAQSLTVDDTLARAGWQIAEYDHTGARVLVRLTGDRKWVGNLFVNRVEIADVDTATAPYGETFAIVAAVGAARPAGWTRADNVRRAA